MDTNKLFKAIQIVVKEEVKKQTSLIKEQVRKEILAELKKSNVKPTISERKIENPFDKALAVLEEDREIEQKQYSKNPALNQILNETAMRPNFSRTDGEWGTLSPEMIGYGEIGMSSQPNRGQSMPVTGNDLIDKAIARSAKVLAASKDKNR
jgi:hypothetical protein